MNVKYDLKRLKEIIDNLAAVAGVTLAVVDEDFEYVYAKERDGDEFCESIHAIEECCEGCRRSDREMLLEARRTKAPVSHLCHAGLLDTVVPILKNGEIVNYVLIGRIRPTPEFNPTLDLFKDSPELWKHRYERLSYLSREQLESLKILLSHIMFDGAIEIEYDSPARAAAAYISENLDKKITISELSRATYVSKNKLYRSFIDCYGCTVGEYITARRLYTAKEMLANSKRSATEIAASVGFENYSYFSKLFLRREGMTPSAYRKKLRNGRE